MHLCCPIKISVLINYLCVWIFSHKLSIWPPCSAVLTEGMHYGPSLIQHHCHLPPLITGDILGLNKNLFQYKIKIQCKLHVLTKSLRLIRDNDTFHHQRSCAMMSFAGFVWNQPVFCSVTLLLLVRHLILHVQPVLCIFHSVDIYAFFNSV